MKVTQYTRLEKAIAANSVADIRQRWMYGLRLLRDPEAMSESGKSLKHGVTDQLIAYTKASGLKLSDREIRRRIQCARTYQTDSQIGHAVADFETWRDLAEAGFPAYEPEDGEPLSDHRTESERAQDRRKALALQHDDDALFPLRDFEPVETTLKDLQVYLEEMAGMTARFVERDRKRREYFDRMVEAAEGDLSTTWADAHELLGDGTEIGEVEP